MDVTMNTAASGMQVSLTRHEITANNVANVNTPAYEQMSARQAEVSPQGVRISGIVRTPDANPAGSGTDLAEQMTNMVVDKNTLSANAKVLKVQDRMIGEVIDLIA
jgi:flagellar hook protein FlgE